MQASKGRIGFSVSTAVRASDVNQHSRHDCRLDPAIETYHSEIILAVFLFASRQYLLLCGGVPQHDQAVIAPGCQPLPIGREGYRMDPIRMPF